MSFLLRLPSLSFFCRFCSDLIFLLVFRNIELRMKMRQKKTTREDERKEKMDRRKEKHTHMHISSIYFTTKQSKSAGRKDFPVSNSQIKQALIQTSSSPVVPQLTPTNSTSWKHTHFTPRQKPNVIL